MGNIVLNTAGQKGAALNAGDRFIGGAGDQTAYILTSGIGNASNVDVNSLIEVVQFAASSSDMKLTYNALTGKIDLTVGTIVLASVQPQVDGNGTQIAAKNGSFFLKTTLVDGQIVAQISDGKDGSTFKTITADYVPVAADIDTSKPSDIGGNVPGPTPEPDGKTFALTINTDVFTGGAGDDIFIAGLDNSLNPGDQLDGGAGANVLKIYDTNGASKFDHATVKNIQKVEHYVDSNINVSANEGVKEVWQNASANKNVTATLAQKIGFGGSGTTETAKFAGTDTGADAATIALKDAGKTAAFTSLTVDNNGVAGFTKIEKLTLEATGKNQITQLAAASLQELIITGSGSLKAANANANLGAATTIKSIDASANTGGVELGLTVTNLTTTAAIKGGSGNDKFILSGNVATTISISGGEGTDTLLVGGATATAAKSKNITGFEYLEFNGAAAHDLDAYTGTLDTLKGVIVSGAVTSVNNLQGESLHNVRYTFDSANGGALTGKGFSTAVTPSNNKATIFLDNSVGKHDSGVDVATSLTFADVRSLTIESVAGNSVLKADGTLATTSSIANLTSTTLTSLTLKGNDSIGVSLASTTAALSEVDASGLTNKAGMFLDLTNNTVTTIGVKGSAGNDYVKAVGTTKAVTLNYVSGGGNDKIAFVTTNDDKVNIIQEDATLKGSSISVDSDFASAAVAATGVVKLDLSTALAGTLKVNNTALGNISSAMLSANFTGKGTALTEGQSFASGTNIILGVDVATLAIQIDVNNDGKFTAADDYQVTIVGASNSSTLGYDAATGDFTFTSA